MYICMFKCTLYAYIQALLMYTCIRIIICALLLYTCIQYVYMYTADACIHVYTRIPLQNYPMAGRKSMILSMVSTISSKPSL